MQAGLHAGNNWELARVGEKMCLGYYGLWDAMVEASQHSMPIVNLCLSC